MTYTDKQIRAFLREVKLEAWAESTPHIRGVGKLLRALREPTVEIGLVGAEQVNMHMRGPWPGADYDAAKDAFRAMLDARMGEG